MGNSDETLADQWLRRTKNHPLVAFLIVVAALIAIVAPIWTFVRPVLSQGPVATPSPIALNKLVSDRDDILVPVKNALRENRSLYERLSSPLYNEPDWGVQESYYLRVRRDGPDKHQIMEHMIDGLVENNAKVLRLLDTYMGRARTREFTDKEAAFREHARLYESRWKGMKAAAINKEEPPMAEPVFPAGFPASLDAEIAAVQAQIDGKGTPSKGSSAGSNIAGF